MAHVAALLGLLLAAACLPDNPSLDGGGGLEESGSSGDQDVEARPRRWYPLIDPDAWVPTPHDHDPVRAHRPELVHCEGGWYREGNGVEVDTKYCNYLSLTQPLLEDLEQGDGLHLSVWWQTLASIDPAEGHLAIYVGDRLIWEEYVPIPGDADARNLDFLSEIDAAAGTPLTLHLHNHGYNTWRFNEVSVLTSRPCQSCINAVKP